MKKITHLFIPYELALKLKEKGFDEECFGHYENESKQLIINFNNLPLTEEQSKRPSLYTISHKNSVLPQWAISAPVFEQVFDWLDKTHKIRISLGTAKTSGKYRFDILQFTEDKWQGDYNLTSFYDSRERNIKAIETALQLI